MQAVMLRRKPKAPIDIITNAHLFGTKRNSKNFGMVHVRVDYPT